MEVATKPMQMTTSPMTFHSAASPGDMRAASVVVPTEGIAALELALIELRVAVVRATAVGSVPIMEWVVPAVVGMVFEDFFSLVTVLPNARLAVSELKTVSTVVAPYWDEKNTSLPRSPAKSGEKLGDKLSTRGRECAVRMMLIKISVCAHIDA